MLKSPAADYAGQVKCIYIDPAGLYATNEGWSLQRQRQRSEIQWL